MGEKTGYESIPAEWLKEFEEAAKWSVEERIKRGFVKHYRPILDDEPFRCFDTMADYRRWCDENLPEWMGFSRPKDPSQDQLIEEGLDLNGEDGN